MFANEIGGKHNKPYIHAIYGEEVEDTTDGYTVVFPDELYVLSV